jgi:Transposase DDE domain
MLSIPQALKRIKGNTAEFLPEAILRRLCRDLQLPFRNRLLTPLVTTHLFLRQILEGNAPVPELQRITKFPFSLSAYCEARQRVPLAFFQQLHHAVIGHCRPYAAADHDALWCGRHRVFFLDGSSFSMPDTPELRDEFGQPGGQAEGCGFPTAHLLVQFDAHHGYIHRILPSPLRTHDMAHAAFLHKELRPGDIVGGDRAFCSYAHLALLQQRRLFGLFRAHQRQIICFQARRPHGGPGQSKKGQAGMPRSRWLKRLGRDDQLVEYFKPAERPEWLDPKAYAALPASLVVRELRVKIKTPGRRVTVLTLVTTLLSRQHYSKRALAHLYELRWGVEVNLKHLKVTLGLDVLRCETRKGVLKELLMFVVVYNLVRRVMTEAARRQGVQPHRISFVDALRWLREAERGEELPSLRVNPSRPGRVEPRVKKRRAKQFDLMNKPRAVLRAALLHKTSPPKEVAA